MSTLRSVASGLLSCSVAPVGLHARTAARLSQLLASRAAGFLASPSIRPCHPRIVIAKKPERNAAVLAETVRRVEAAIPGAVDLGALRQALETAGVILLSAGAMREGGLGMRLQKVMPPTE